MPFLHLPGLWGNLKQTMGSSFHTSASSLTKKRVVKYILVWTPSRNIFNLYLHLTNIFSLFCILIFVCVTIWHLFPFICIVFHTGKTLRNDVYCEIDYSNNHVKNLLFIMILLTRFVKQRATILKTNKINKIMNIFGSFLFFVILVL